MNAAKDIIKQMNDFGRYSEPFLFIIDFGMAHPLLIPVKAVSPDEIRFDVNGFGNSGNKYNHGSETDLQKFPVTLDEYRHAFDKVIRHIRLGNTYLLNLTFKTKIQTSLSLTEIFDQSQAPYKLYYNDKFVVFSPEPFVKIDNNIISSYPMKGTIDAGIPYAQNVLLNDSKELAEHNTIVDLIRNDLSMVSENVRVEKFRYIEKIKTHEKELLQTSSKISGNLPPDWKEHIGEILVTLLPAGSISGAPKQKTVEIIKSVENFDRGYFTGIFGYFDGHKLESAVMIRFIERVGDALYFKSGGGITSFSQCESEYREMVDKVYLPI